MIQGNFNMTKVCKYCGKEFEGTGTARYCKGPHYATCEICGREFEVDPRRVIRTCSAECKKKASQLAKSRNTKICEECGKEFHPSSGTQKYCKRPHITTCVICKKEFTYTCSPNEKPATCSRECQTRLQESTIKEKYGISSLNQLMETSVETQEQDTTITRKCRYCGKEFQPTEGGQYYCTDTHYSTCECCGTTFVQDVRNPRKTCSTSCMQRMIRKNLSSSIKLCKYCGELFVPSGSMSEYCKRTHYATCTICGKEFEITSLLDVPKTCSEKCKREQTRITSRELYGTDVPTQSESVKQKLHDISVRPDVIQKRKQTSLSHYGVDNPAKNLEVRRRISNTVKSDAVQNQIRTTTRSRYGVDYAMQNPTIVEKLSKTMESKYGVPYYCLTEECRAASGHTISRINQQFSDMMNDMSIEHSLELRLETKSFDIAIEKNHILIELNPSYTHSTMPNHWGDGLDVNYHKEKSLLASQHGYHCIHIFDWDNIDKILNMLKPRQHIYARKCEIQELSAIMLNTFLTKYHLQGTCKGQTFAYGLFHQRKLIQVMTFGKARYSNKHEYELLRLCTLPGYQVVGGASKLFKHFLKEQNPSSIISYCDLSKFSGDVYTSLGMKLDHINSPACIWSKNSEYIRHSLLLQRGYDQLFGTHYGKGTSNEELMIENGWLPVYDCGQSVYTWIQ